MDTATVEQAFVEAHKDLQDQFGHNGSVISGPTTPLNDLKGFRSVLIPNIIRAVARRIGITPPKGDEIRNIYISNDRRRKLSISEIAKTFTDKYCSEV